MELSEVGAIHPILYLFILIDLNLWRIHLLCLPYSMLKALMKCHLTLGRFIDHRPNELLQLRAGCFLGRLLPCR